jgi:hypothetical protein
LAVLLYAGCVTSGARAPAETLRSYSKAIASDSPAAAYQLLSPTLQRAVPLEEFTKQWRDNRSELAEQRQQLLALLAKPDGALTQHAEVRLAQGSVVRLDGAPQRFGQAWLLSDANLQVVAAHSPQDVLRLLLLAVEQRNYAALLRLLSADERRALEAQLNERVERLRGSLVRPNIEIKGDHARIEYDPRFFIDLVREGDSWRIADLN